jgi:hypothetical protein
MTGSIYQFLDANLIMYILGGPHPLQDPSKRILNKIKQGVFRVVTNTEVLQEILYRYFSVRKPGLGELAYFAMINLCQEIIPITVKETDRALELLKGVPSITSRDAFHAATMLNNGVNDILSTDTHFDLIPGIRRIDPATTG